MTDLDPRPTGVLATDFDGTLTDRDAFVVIAEQLAPEGPAAQRDHWAAYRAGELSLFDALDAIFTSIGHHDEATVRAALDGAGLQPGLADLVAQLRAGGWEVVVVSAGCEWYIRHLLAGAGVDLEVVANPGRFIPGRGIVMHPPTDSPYASATHGVDKAAVVRDLHRRYDRVAFAGDGVFDLDAAREVAADLRFARRDLARVAADEGLGFRSFDRWADVAAAVLAS